MQKLSLFYGIDSDGDFAANYYVKAIDVVPVSLWLNVVSVKLSLVLKSTDDNLTSASTSYTVDNVAYSSSDKRLYRVFGSSIALRNLLY